MLLVVDNGWASAATGRADAGGRRAARPRRTGRPQVALLATAPDGTGRAHGDAPPCRSPTCAPGSRRLQPRALAAGSGRARPRDARTGRRPRQRRRLCADGLTDGSEFAAVRRRARRPGPVTECCGDDGASRLLLPPRPRRIGWSHISRKLPQPVPARAAVLAQSGDGRTLARADVTLPAGASDRHARDHAAARVAQPARPPGAGRAALGRLRRAAGRTLAAAARRAAGGRYGDRRHAVTGPLYYLDAHWRHSPKSGKATPRRC